MIRVFFEPWAVAVLLLLLAVIKATEPPKRRQKLNRAERFAFRTGNWRG